MTKTQLYIIIIIVSLFGLGWLGLSEPGRDSCYHNPLRIHWISCGKNTNDFDAEIYSTLKTLIGVDIGPSPQPEKLLSIMQVDLEKFKGVLASKFTFVEKSDTFQYN